MTGAIVLGCCALVGVIVGADVLLERRRRRGFKRRLEQWSADNERR